MPTIIWILIAALALTIIILSSVIRSNNKNHRDEINRRVRLVEESKERDIQYKNTEITRLNKSQEQMRDLFAEIYNSIGDDMFLKLSHAPKDVKIGQDGLPYKLDDSGTKWGLEYTFPHTSGHYHVFGCQYATSRCSNAYTLHGGHIRPCRICKPKLPDCSWIRDYEHYKLTARLTFGTNFDRKY